MKYITRRDFLKLSALSACSLVISTGLSGCNEKECSGANVSFDHGIASGDPQQDKIIIWTRATTEALCAVVDYEVATDEGFANIIRNGSEVVNAATDYTLKVDVRNLNPNTVYYYRFSSNGTLSDMGRMKTLPVGATDSVRMAVFSCANYPNGYFNAYELASQLSDLDVTIHLGDYIYEYGMFEEDGVTPAYATENAEAIGRVLPADNDTECFTLEDYRKRYALYRTDRGLQAIHKAAPMIVVWDDHEIANDAYKDGAENHEANEGDFQTRVEASLKAYFEWLPIRPVTEDQKVIYRTFDFGDLLSLNMLETRVLGRDEQLNYADYYDAQGNFDATTFTADLTSPTRTMTGASQLAWLQGEFATSTTTWQVLGQQVLMGRMLLPAELLGPIAMLENPAAYGTTKEALMAQINTLLTELATIKTRILQGDLTVTTEERARVETTLPYNLDAWDGYFYEREVIFNTAKAYGKNLVVLAGDTHNSWANELRVVNGDRVGVEFATTSVTSPGLEQYLGLGSQLEAIQLEPVITLLVDDLKYTNLYDRGFMEVTFMQDKVVTTWHYVDNYHSETYTESQARLVSKQTVPDEKTVTDL